jgi:hypothetical protein
MFKNLLCIFVEKIYKIYKNIYKYIKKYIKIYKMGCLEGSGVPALYIGSTVPKG